MRIEKVLAEAGKREGEKAELLGLGKKECTGISLWLRWGGGVRQGFRLGGPCLCFLPFVLLILHLFSIYSSRSLFSVPRSWHLWSTAFLFPLQFLGGLISCDAGDKRVRLAIQNLFPSPFLPGALGSAVIFYQTPQLLKSDTPHPALVFWQLHLALPGRPELGDAAPWG